MKKEKKDRKKRNQKQNQKLGIRGIEVAGEERFS